MGYENVKLWFAKDESDKIVTIDEIHKGKKTTYQCPVCGSGLKPKAIDSKRITPHFAHIDASKCNSESQIHFWFKHKFLEKGDKFAVTTKKVKNYVCKDILVEQVYKVNETTYKPDVTIITDCGKTIFFEMAFSNKKKVKDYLDHWLELGNIVVEVDIKQLTLKDNLPTFKALFYNGKCFNTKRNDTYYNTIGKYKEVKLNGKANKELKERLHKLDWFWDEIFKYKKNQVELSDLVDLIDSIEGEERKIVNEILIKNRCKDIFKDYYNYKLDNSYRIVKNHLLEHLDKDYLKLLDRSLIDYGKYMEAFIEIESYYWRDGSRIRFPYRLGSKGIADRLNIENYSQSELNAQILRLMNLNIKYIKHDNEIYEYNSKVKECIDSIKSNERLLKLIYNLNKRGNLKYSINISPKYHHIDPRDIISGQKNLKYLWLKFELLVNESESPVVHEIKRDIESYNIEEICCELEDLTNNYIEQLTPINVKLMNSLVENIFLDYLHCKIEIKGRHILEDVFQVYVFYNDGYLDDFLITNQGIIKFLPKILKSTDYLLKTEDMFIIKDYVIESINGKISKKLDFTCSDCSKPTSLTLGELKFFNKKGFQLPKRCKSCRNSRKQTKSEVKN
ncbi:hypothetical protein EVU96_09255 [Bacillus infantis]|uniref:competence protein CoiA family protein n=1 Tax=Bacillus infantis TaxID=324767 RepID=UPI00101C1959|nr:zinc-ribbon domain containing protein [Bacillus infantis]RYI30592.1 hypothetical protein EVU96_09255 [Bacillus infantis]